MPFHGILFVLLLILAIGVVVALVRLLFGTNPHGVNRRDRSPDLDVVEERYTKARASATNTW